MTVLSRVNFASQQRLDLTHVLASDSFAANDFRALTSFFTGLSNAYVVAGMVPESLAGLSVSIKVSNSVIFNPMDSSGAFYFALPTDADVILTLPANTAMVYVQARFLTETQAQVNQAYWNPLAITGNSAAGNEYTASADSQVVTVLEISNNSSGFSQGYIPIMKCQTLAASVVNIVDCRPLFFRLGVGGASPDSYHAFPWSATRGESASSTTIVGDSTTGSAFQSTDGITIKNDKGISTMKQWMDAVMTRISEIAGTPLWYDNSLVRTYVSDLNLSTAYFDSDAGHSLNAHGLTTLIWNNNYTFAGEGTSVLTWQANYGPIKWHLGNTYSSGRIYSDTKFVSPTVNDGKNLYLMLQREVAMGIGASLSWATTPSFPVGVTGTPPANANGWVSGNAGDFTNIAVGDYVRKASEGMSQYHLITGVLDGINYITTVGYVASSAATGLFTTDVLTYSSEALRYFRSNYSSADLTTDQLGPIFDSDYLWIGRRTGKHFMLRRFGTMVPGQEIQVLSNGSFGAVGSSGGHDLMNIIFGNATTFSSAGSLSANAGNNSFQITKQRKSDLLSPTSNNSLGELTFTLPTATALSVPAGSSVWASLPDSAPLTCSAGLFTAAAQYIADLSTDTPVLLTSQAGFSSSDTAAAETLYYVRNISGVTFNLYTAASPGGTQVDATLTSALGGFGFIYANASMAYNAGVPAHDPTNAMVPRAQLYVLTAAQTATEEFDLRNLYLIASRVESISYALVASSVVSTTPALSFFDGSLLALNGQLIENGLAMHGATQVFGGVGDSFVTTPVFLGDGNTYAGANNTLVNQSLMAPGKTVESILGGLNAVITSQADEINTGFVSWTSGSAPYYSVGGNFTVTGAGLGRIKGQEVAWLANQSVALPANGSFGVVYINAVGTLLITSSVNDALYQNNIPMFEIFVDSAGVVFVAKENHPYAFNTSASRYLHNNVGTVIRSVGAAISVVTPWVSGTPVTANSELKFVTADFLEDHGLVTTIPTTNPIVWNFMYTNAGAVWTRDGSATAVFAAKYNNAGVLTALTTSGAGSVGVVTLYVAKDDLSGAPLYLAVYDTSSYPDSATAQTAIDNGTTARATGNIAFLESAQLGYAIIQNTATGSYIANALVDKSTFNSKVVGGGNQGLASLVSVTTNTFDGMLNGTDTNVQQALENIDDYAKDSSFKVQNVADATKLFKVDVEDVPTATSSRGRIPVPGVVAGGTGDFILGITAKSVSGSYSALQGDRVLITGVGASSPTSVLLPPAPANGTFIEIKDAGLTASKYPVTVSVGVTTDTLELGTGAYVLCEDGFSVTFQYNLGNWSVQSPAGVSASAKQVTATASPSWDSVDVPFEAIATSVSTTNTVTPSDLGSTKGRAMELLPADYVQAAMYRNTASFAGLTSLQLQLGDSPSASNSYTATPAKFTTFSNLLSAVGANSNMTPVLESLTMENQMVANFTGNAALNSLSTGVLQLQLLKSNLIGTPGARNQPTWKKFVINYKDVAALGAVTSGSITIPAKFAGYHISDVAFRSSRAFVGLSTPTVSLTLNSYSGVVPAISSFVPTTSGKVASNNLATPVVFGPATALSAILNWSAANNLLNATDGELEIYLLISQYEVPTQAFWNASTVIQQLSSTPTWVKYSVPFSSFAAFTAGTPQYLNIAPLYGDEVIHTLFAKTRTAFAAPGSPSVFASVGDGILVPASSSPSWLGSNVIFSGYNLASAVGENNISTPNSYIYWETFDSSSKMMVLGVTVSASVSLTAGLLDVYVLKSKLASK